MQSCLCLESSLQNVLLKPSCRERPATNHNRILAAVLYCLDAMACVCLIRRAVCWCRQVDLGMLLALLAAVSSASCEERLTAAYKLLLWQAGTPLLPRPLAVAYVRLLKVCALWHLLGRMSLCLKHAQQVA